MERMYITSLDSKQKELIKEYFDKYSDKSKLGQYLGQYLSGRKKNDAIIPI